MYYKQTEANMKEETAGWGEGVEEFAPYRALINSRFYGPWRVFAAPYNFLSVGRC